MSGIEHIEHAGDARIELRAENLEELFELAAVALLDLITDPAGIAERVERTIDLEADRPDELLVRWLNELLFVFETEGLLLRRFDLRIEQGRRLRATARGERYEPGRHPIEALVKAATYHQLELSGQPGDWSATVVLDL